MDGGQVVALGVVKFWRVDGSDFNNFLLWYRFQSVTARGYFDEAVEDDEEFRKMGGNNSANEILLTLVQLTAMIKDIRKHITGDFDGEVVKCRMPQCRAPFWHMPLCRIGTKYTVFAAYY